MVFVAQIQICAVDAAKKERKILLDLHDYYFSNKFS